MSVRHRQVCRFARRLSATAILLAGIASANNPTLSKRVLNVSETSPPISADDYNPEIAIFGSTVHLMWFTGLPQSTGVSYARSADNGKSWQQSRQLLSRADLDTNNASKRMVVDSNGVVHIAVAAYPKNAENQGVPSLYYLRSADGGVTWDAPVFAGQGPTFWNIQYSFISTDAGKTTIGALYTDYPNTNYPSVKVGLYTTSDGGRTFKTIAGLGHDRGNFARMSDLKRAADRMYYLRWDGNPMYLDVYSDDGAVAKHTLVSTPSAGGDHTAQNPQRENYVSKIAVSGRSVCVIWADKADSQSVFVRCSADGGVTFANIQNLSKGAIPAGAEVYWGFETIAAKGNYFYAVFRTSDGRIYLRRSADGGVSFGPLVEVTSTAPYAAGGWQPLIEFDPRDPAGAKVYVWWSTAWVYSGDGGTTFTKPAVVGPNFSWAALYQPRFAIASDGTIHWAVRGKTVPNVDLDIFYGNWPPAPDPGRINMSLAVAPADDPLAVYDSMEIRAVPELNFKDRMTAEVWAMPGGGNYMPNNDHFRTAIYRSDTRLDRAVYSLGTFGEGTQRRPGATVNTTGSGLILLSPRAGSSVITDGTWYHFALTYDAGGGTGNLKLYLNGSVVAAATASGPLATTDGAIFAGYFGAWTLDELRFWNRALTADEINANMSRTLTGSEPGLAAYYNFDNTTKDVTGRGNDGVLLYNADFVLGSFNGASIGKCGGTCALAAPGQVIGASGGPGSIGVTATSTWDVIPIDSWITVTSASAGAGNGTVTFTVPANTGPPRSGSIAIGGQIYTIHQNGTPGGTTAGCSYLIQSSSAQSVPVTGTSSGLIQIVTNQNCAWTATTAAAWITIRSGASGTGNGAVSYAAAANDAGVARSAAIVIAGQVVAVNQAGGAIPGTPAISDNGVVNTASYAPGAPPNGSLAQGSFFSIYGSDMGPDAFVKADAYPLPKTLGGVGVQIVQGANRYDAFLVFVSKGQINGILPSNVPVGDAQVVIGYNGKTSRPSGIRVAKTSLGVFFQRVSGKDLAIAQNVKSATDYPLNLPDTPAKPGQIVILWATGLGPVAGADNTAPGGGDLTGVPVEIAVGGVAARRLYAGRQPETAAVDNIYFEVPQGVPYGCQVPVTVKAGGTAANTTLIAITADGTRCN